MPPTDAPRAGERALIYPGLSDPRWLQVLFLTAFDLYALSAPGFSRVPAQYLAGVGTCVVLDLALLFFYRGLLLLPVSGFISSMGLLLLVDSPFVWPYAAVAALTILSKHLVRADGRHVFNPLNFGVVAGLLFFSGEMTVVAERWGGGNAGMLGVVALGCLVVWRAKRWDLAAAYWATFLAGAWVRSLATGAGLAVLTAPMTGAAFQLFTFFMITDPMTTPETRRGRILFAVALGALDNLLRWQQVSFAPFYALFVLTAFMPLWRRAFPAPVREQVWRPRSVRLPQGA